MSVKVLLIGGGPSFRNKLNLARGFEGIIITHAANFKEVMENGIRPDYIAQYETQVGLNLEHYPPEDASLGIPIVYNIECITEFKRHLTNNHFKSIPFFSAYHGNINNVGLFSAYFAREHLKATHIYLIGFDHEGMEYHANVYPKWVENFKVFVEAEKDHCEVINCTGTGKLYGKGITDGSSLITLN